MTRITRNMDAWLAPQNTRLPNFIICGAMKSGTTTLHEMLGTHPSVFIPDGELFFFDIDDILEHPDFVRYNDKGTEKPRLEDAPSIYWQWYSEHFSGALEQQVIGEDSTTYLSSHNAFERIALQATDIKLIIMLRHPTDRAYSHYWHLLRTGRVATTFEDTLKLNPASLLSRSLYEGYLKNMYQHIKPENVLILLFDEFLASKERILQTVSDHLGLSYSQFPDSAYTLHKNASKYPQYLRLYRTKNSLLRQMLPIDYSNRLHTLLLSEHQKKIPKQRLRTKTRRLIDKLYLQIDPLESTKPTMNPSTKEMLDKYFASHMRNINELVGKDVYNIWFPK